MSRPIVIDSQAFGLDGGLLQGELLVASLTRLHDLLTDSSGAVVYRIEGRVGPPHRPQWVVDVTGVLFLCCQRCLETLAYPLAVHSLLEFVDDDADLTQEELEDDSRDFLPNQKALDVAVLIEDEILLALPTVLRHDGCVLPGSGGETAKVSRFSVLAGLQGKAE